MVRLIKEEEHIQNYTCLVNDRHAVVYDDQCFIGMLFENAHLYCNVYFTKEPVNKTLKDDWFTDENSGTMTTWHSHHSLRDMSLFYTHYHIHGDCEFELMKELSSPFGLVSVPIYDSGSNTAYVMEDCNISDYIRLASITDIELYTVGIHSKWIKEEVVPYFKLYKLERNDSFPHALVKELADRNQRCTAMRNNIMELNAHKDESMSITNKSDNDLKQYFDALSDDQYRHYEDIALTRKADLYDEHILSLLQKDNPEPNYLSDVKYLVLLETLRKKYIDKKGEHTYIDYQILVNEIKAAYSTFQQEMISFLKNYTRNHDHS